MQTTEATFGTRTQRTTFMADTRGIHRIGFNDLNALSFSFIFNEELQLSETPIANPPIEDSASSLFSYSFKVLHYNLVPDKIRHNLFTDVMVYPGHETSFSSRKLPEKSSGTLGAFGLKPLPNIFESAFNLLNTCRTKEFASGSHNKVVDSKINAKGLSFESTFIYFHGKYENEITSAFIINLQQTLFNIPGSEIVSIAFGNVKDKTFTFVNCSNSENIAFQISAAGEVISDRAPVDDWLGFSTLDYSTSLFNACNSYLGWQQEVSSQVPINNMMEFKIVFYPHFPSSIYTELQSLRISLGSANYFTGCRNLNLGCCDGLHQFKKSSFNYKPCASMSPCRNVAVEMGWIPYLLTSGGATHCKQWGIIKIK